jgi:fibrillarin-like pre-rRNA processing protein
MRQISPGLWSMRGQLLTQNLVPGFRSYTEQLISIGSTEYRIWDPTRSKLAAAVAKGLKGFPVQEGMKILYLGAAQGYTPSFFSDIVGRMGVIYAVEISERAFRELNPVAEKRGNIVPILADARKPQDYGWIETCGLVYQDVATSDQPEILIRNCKAKLKDGGLAVIAIKSRSIDVVREPKDVFRECVKRISEEMELVEKVELDPLEKDHMLAVFRFRR